MPLVVRGRKRRAEAAPTDSPDSSISPEPQARKRRVTPHAAASSSEDEEEEEEPDNDRSANFAGPPTTTNGNTNHDQAVKKLVRLALASELQRRPLRRTDITEKVLGKDSGRSANFKNVFAATQQQLQQVFGMKLVELPAREKATLAQKRAAQKSESQGSKAATQWILTSTLPYQFRDPAILPPLNVGAEGSDATYTGLYTLLVSLILLSGGSMDRAKMERYLRRLGIEDQTPVYGSEKTEKFLKRLEREGYLQEVREKAMQGEEDVSYIVGPRGKVEVGRQGVEGLVKAVYGDLLEDGEQEEELERRIQRSLGVGEEVVKRVRVDGEGRKKRGRPRKDADEEDEESGSEEEDEEGEELYE